MESVMLGLLMGLLLTACASPTPTPSVAPTPSPTPTPRRLVICQADEPTTLYRYLGSRLSTRNVWDAIYDGPIDGRGYDYQPIILEKLPSLAVVKEVAVAPGDLIVNQQGDVVPHQGTPTTLPQLTVTFRLKAGLRWSDGEPLTADDSVYSFEVARHPATPRPLPTFVPREWPDYPSLADRTVAYSALDARTVQWTGLPGYLPPTYFLNFFPPLPRHDLDRYRPAELLEAEEAARLPLGWGPFTIVEWMPGLYIHLVRNPYYLRAAEGLPRFDEVIFHFGALGDDQLDLVLDGTCHIGTRNATDPGDLPRLRQLERAGRLQPIAAPSRMWERLAFNLVPTDGRPPLLADRRVRQAIAHGVNRQALINAAIGYAIGPVPDSYIPAEHPFHGGRTLTRYGYDPDRARALLAQAGWADSDGDGVADKDGQPLTLTLLTADTENRRRIAQQLVADLAEIGVWLTLDVRPAREIFRDGPEGPVFGRRFDLVLYAWLSGHTPPCHFFLSEAIPGPGNDWTGENVSGYSNPDFDTACRAALTTLDRGQARALHVEAQRLWTADLPALPLFFQVTAAMARPEVVGYTLDPTQPSELWNLEEINLLSKVEKR